MASKVESESYIPVGTIYFEEREDGLLHEKEALKRTMVQHELTFKNQVQELHRLYRVQRDLMQEYQQNNNNSQTNSFSSQNPTNNNNNNNNNNNFEFIREDSAQSSLKNAIIPIISSQNQNGNVTNVSVFGKREVVDLNEDVSTFGKRGGVDLNEDVSVFGKRVADGNGINGSGLDFMGVNKRAGFDEGSGSGKFGLFPDREKGGSSAGINNNFFTSQINPQQPIFTTSNNNINNNNPFPINNNNNNFLVNYKPPQQSYIFPNQFSVNPQLFPQSLTINFDPSQINNNNENNNNNNNVNNNVSYPVLDSSPHYINLDKNKNKSPIPGFIHTIPVPVQVFNNRAFNAGTNENLSNSSFYFSNNFSKNPTHIPLQNSPNPPRNPNPTSLFGNSNSKLNRDRNSNLNLNEPAQERIIQSNNNNNKGVKIFGANCEGSSNNKANETSNNQSLTTGDDSKKLSSSITTGGVHYSNLTTKLLGFPFFTNPSSSSSYEIKPVPNSVIPKPVRDSAPESESGTKRTVIDLNEAYNNNNDSAFSDASDEIGNKGRKAIVNFDLNDDLSCENDSSALELEAANNIIILSSAASKTVQKPSDPLSWFADIVVAGQSDPVPESESDTDSYEQLVLKLESVTTEERFGPDKYNSVPNGETGQQTGYGSMLYSKGKRGPARKRRQKRDFQRDVLPALASLSRVEVSEDLQLIGGLVRASGQEFDMALTRRVGRSGSSRRKQRAPPAGGQESRSSPGGNREPRGGQTGQSDPPHGITQGCVTQTIRTAVPLPPRFPVSHQMRVGPPQMSLVRVDQVQGQQVGLVHVKQHEQQQQGRNVEMSLVQVDQLHGGGMSGSVIGWERFTRRARRPRGPPPAQQHRQHHHHQQQGNNNNNNNIRDINNNNNGGGEL